VGTAGLPAIDGGSLGAAAVLAAARSRPGQPSRPPGGAPAREEGAPLLKTKCPNCGTMVPIYTDAYPVKVTCPTCGKGGIYRGPKGRAG